MKNYKELSSLKLNRIYNPNSFNFSSTEELTPIDGIIGQERAVKAMAFGLQVKNSRYNIFVAGLKGTGKTSYTQKVVQEKAKLENTPDDWCYVYNFDNPSRPMALNIPPGMGKIFCEDMEELIQDLFIEVPKAFSEDDYERRKAAIIKQYQEEKSRLLKELIIFSKESGFTIKNTNSGFIFAPLMDGEAMTDQDYAELDEESKHAIEKNADDVQIKAAEFLRKIKALERKTKRKIIELDNMIGLFAVQPLIDELLDKYKRYEKVIAYLKAVENDVIENIYDFKDDEDEEGEMPVKQKENSFMKKYKVNVFVDHSHTIGAPVIMEWNPNYHNLVGKIEYENEQGTLKTDFTMIKPGSIHKANGGYLILKADQVLSNFQSWETLKRTLEMEQVCIESLRTQLGIVDITSLKPDPIPVSLKIIIIGNPYLYQLLYRYDEDFEKFFKIKVDFDATMEVNPSNEMKIAQFIGSYCNEKGIRHVDHLGVAEIMVYSHRMTGTQKKFTTQFNKIVELLIEADVWAELDHSPFITDRHVKKAYREKIYRHNMIEEKIQEMYTDGKIIADLKGRKIGRIHGLSIIDVGDYIFGKPSVITATTFVGNKGVVNIEREANLSGAIHDKGIMILEGYLCEKFAQHESLNLTGKICFEQSYNGVDGDSASSAELYVLLSNLSDIPLKQTIAVTGSVNQKGEIQPVGGVSEKIEGMFFLCSEYGLTGEHGVIIPYQNIEDLVLCDEVIQAVKQKKFHIYPVTHIEEGIEILTDIPFLKICDAIQKKLQQYRVLRREEKKEERNESISIK